ncbi:MAG: SpoIIE family protein phosphatase, partial [Bacteroidales bacterium]|nr:SpoIIE family protein phosphatase [Bacteroidales bacterium]
MIDKKKYFYLFYIFFLVAFNGFSQNYSDSLLNIALSSNCPDNALSYQKLGNFYKNTDPNKAISCFLLGKNTAFSCNEIEIATVCANMAGMMYFYQNNYTDALIEFEFSYNNSNVFSNKIAYKNNIGEIYIKLGSYTDALNLFNQQLVDLSKNENIKGQIAAYSNIALIYKELGEIDSSIYYYKNALKLFTTDTSLVGEILLNQADLYLNISMIDSALYYLDWALRLVSKNNNQSVLAQIYFEYFLLYKKTGDFSLADSASNKALYFFKKIDNTDKIVSTFIEKSSLAFQNENLILASSCLDSASFYFSSLLSINTKERYYYQQYILNTKLDDYEKALEFYKVYANYSDSIKNNKLLHLVRIKDFKLLTQQLAIADIEITKSKQRTFYVILFFIIVVVLFFVFLFVIKRQLFFKKSSVRFQNKFEQANKELSVTNKNIKAQSVAFLALQKATQPGKTLEVLLDEILVEILKIDFLSIENKACIFLKNSSTELKRIVSVNMNDIKKQCTIIKSDFCLCGLSYTNDKVIFNNIQNVEHKSKSHKHYISPLKWGDEKLGVITFYLSLNQVLEQYQVDFLNNLALTISGIIKQKISADLTQKKANELMSLVQKNYAQSVKIDQQRIMVEQSANKISKQSVKLKSTLKDLQDSINYAEYFVEYFLPPKKLLDTILIDYSIFFKPKEAIGGDFYYATKQNNHVFFILADATGHGVPGSFLSILALNFLRDLLKRDNTHSPARILELLRKRTKSIFHGAAPSIKFSGYEGAAFFINLETSILTYSGAYTPLYIYNKNELVKFSSNRTSIGFFYKNEKFLNVEIKLQPNNIIYLFSDGIVDQFGGENMSKYTRKRFLNLIKEVAYFPLAKQTDIIKNNFLEWKAKNEQTDDVSFFAMKWHSQNSK